MRVTPGMLLMVAAAVALMALPWITSGPAAPPPADAAIVLVVEQPADDLCPLA